MRNEIGAAIGVEARSPLKPGVVVLAETGGNESTGLRGADGLAGAGLGEDDMPEIDVGGDEANTHEAALALLAERSDVALGGF